MDEIHCKSCIGSLGSTSFYGRSGFCAWFCILTVRAGTSLNQEWYFFALKWLKKNSGCCHTEEKRKIQALTIRSTNSQDPEAVGEVQVVAQVSSCQAQYYISCFCLLHFQPKLPICEKQIRTKLLQRPGLGSSADDKHICTRSYNSRSHNKGIQMYQWVRSALFSLKTGKHGIYLESPYTNHRIVEWFGLEGTFKSLLVHPPCSKQGHLPLDQVDQSPIQPGLECFQGWGIYPLSGQPVPVFHHPHRKKCLPYI